MSFRQRVKDLARRALQPAPGGGLSNAVRNRLMGAFAQRQARRASALWPSRPESLNFEITSICDAKCIHCPREEMDRRMKPMDLALFRKMVDQAAELGVPELVPNGYGEILTMRNVEEYLGYISSKAHPFRVVINTNGYRMTEEKIELFFKHRVHLLNICVDGATAETAEKVRVQLELEQIEQNIHRVMALRRERGTDHPRIRVGMIVIPQNRHEVNAFLTKWRGVVDYVGLGGVSNRAGSVRPEILTGEAIAPVRACVLPFRDMNVYSDGKAVLCCDDWNEEYVVGDLNTQSLGEIWRGEAFTRARRAHMEARGADVSVCAKCNFWRDAGPARLWA